MGMTVARKGEVRREEKLERETREWERLLLAHPPPLSTPAKQATFHLSLTATSLQRPLTAVPKVAVVERSQPPPQALRFSHGRGSAKRVTGDEPQGTMGRVQTVGEARCLLPAFLCADIFIKRETSGYEAGRGRVCESVRK